jgi:signal transduction histidine kinase
MKSMPLDSMMLLEAVAETLSRATGEVQLPLHILLENRFGDLNENQEEMLQAASSAADRIDLASRHLQRILDLEYGRIGFQREAVRLGDVLQAALAIAAAHGESRDVKVSVDRPPVSPFVVADRYFLGEALTALLTAAADRAEASTELKVQVTPDGKRVGIVVNYSGGPLDGLELVMATRLIQAQKGSVEVAAGRVAVSLSASDLGGHP